MARGFGSFAIKAGQEDESFENVQSFQEAKVLAARLLSIGLVIAFGLSLTINVALAITVAAMFPLHRLVPLALVVRNDGTIDDSVALSTLPPSEDQAIVRAALWQYVQNRESYSYDTAQYRYDVTSSMSDNATRATYQQWFLPGNPQSPQNVIGKNGQVSVSPIAVAMIGPNVAQVRYERTYSTGTNDDVTTTWTATLQFAQINTMSAADRLNDPAGVVITNYQNEEDTAE